MESGSCLLWNIPCDTLIKGGLVTILGFVLFVGSVLLVLAAVFGRWMGYLVMVVGFAGWMMILSALWTFGFYSQGPDTPVNLGPRGAEPAWVVESAGTAPQPVYEAYASYPGGQGWREPGTNDADEGSVQSVTSATQGFLAEQANEELGVGQHDVGRSRRPTSRSRASSSSRRRTASRFRRRARSSTREVRCSPCSCATTRAA